LQDDGSCEHGPRPRGATYFVDASDTQVAAIPSLSFGPLPIHQPGLSDTLVIWDPLHRHGTDVHPPYERLRTGMLVIVAVARPSSSSRSGDVEVEDQRGVVAEPEVGGGVARRPHVPEPIAE